MDSVSCHRSPETLLRLAQTQVVKIVHEGVTSLREKGSNWCLKYFASREPLALRRHAMKTIQDYLAQASHMFQVCITWSAHKQIIGEQIVQPIEQTQNNVSTEVSQYLDKLKEYIKQHETNEI